MLGFSLVSAVVEDGFSVNFDLQLMLEKLGSVSPCWIFYVTTPG